MKTLRADTPRKLTREAAYMADFFVKQKRLAAAAAARKLMNFDNFFAATTPPFIDVIHTRAELKTSGQFRKKRMEVNQSVVAQSLLHPLFSPVPRVD